MTKTYQKFEWNKDWEIGIPEIDLQHKKLISISNELYDVATKGGESFKADMGKVLKSFTDYTIYHFSNEEKNFQEKYNYPGLAMHKVAHNQFIAELKNQVAKLERGATVDDAFIFYEYISNWIITHIGKADPVWAKFVKPQL